MYSNIKLETRIRSGTRELATDKRCNNQNPITSSNFTLLSSALVRKEFN